MPRPRPEHAPHLAAHPHPTKLFLDQLPDPPGNLADGKLRRIAARRRRILEKIAHLKLCLFILPKIRKDTPGTTHAPLAPEGRLG